MDKNVPAGAAILLDFIRKTEVGTDDRSSYDVIYGHNQDKLPSPITSITIDDIQTAQRSWSRRFGSSATGGYQFMRATLKSLIEELGLSGSQTLDPDLQDRLGYHLLIRRGYHKFIAGHLSVSQFGKLLAQEWASFPVLAMTKGAHRTVKRGQSYYAGDGLNKALVKPATIESVLGRVKEAALQIPDIDLVPVPKPTPAPSPPERVAPPRAVNEALNDADKPAAKSKTVLATILAGGSGLVATFADTFGGLDPAIQLVLIAVIVCAAGFVIWDRTRKRRLAQRAKGALA